MELTNKQEQGLKIAVSNYNLGMPYTVISGFAGAGKTTLIRFIIDALNLKDDDVAYVAYTGKAANVLRQKGCPNAMTAHKLLYYARPLPNGQFTFEPRKGLEHLFKLIVVDEVSMLPKDMWELLLSHGVHVLASGDPGQLPPVEKEGDKEINNHVLDHPHIFLDEIMRQAQDSAIIRLSMHIREGKDFTTFPNASGEVRIIKHAADLFKDMSDYQNCLLGADQILSGTNKQRRSINDMVRKLKGRGTEPEIGDKVIGLSNHWNFPSREGVALTNGSIGKILTMQHIPTTFPHKLNLPAIDILECDLSVEGEDDEFWEVPIDYQFLTTQVMSLDSRQLYRLRNYVKNYRGTAHPPSVPMDFDYGYAITVWKAQGSEWDRILGFDAKWVLYGKGEEMYKQYLYTLVTRASKMIILVGD